MAYLVDFQNSTQWVTGGSDLSLGVLVPAHSLSGLLVAIASGTRSFVVPSGWQSIGPPGSAAGYGGSVYRGAYKLADGSETTLQTFDLPNTGGGSVYEMQVVTLASFAPRSFPYGSDWEQVAGHLITGGVGYDAAADTGEQTDLVIYFLSVFMESGLATGDAGYDVNASQTITLDAQLTPETLYGNAETHVISDTDPRTQRGSYMFAIATAPVVGGNNPATSNSITGTPPAASGLSRFEFRTLGIGIAVLAPQGYWGILVAPV